MVHLHNAAAANALRCPQCAALRTRLQVRPGRLNAGALRSMAASADEGGPRSTPARPPTTPGQRQQGGVDPKRGGRVLLKGGTVLSMDRSVGDFEDADVLIDGKKIAAIGPNLEAGEAQVLDASNMIVTPGFIDTHRHMWQGALRMIVPDGDLGDYLRDVLSVVAPHYTPEDVYASNLLSAVGALNAGITTILDWSHISNSPEHSDAAVEALRDSGIRAVYAYSHSNNGNLQWWTDDSHKYPNDIHRVKQTYFSSDDQLVTLALAAAGPEFGSPEIAAMEWNLAREIGCRITTHVGVSTFGMQGKLEALSKLVKLGDDATYIHCSTLSDAEWAMIEDTGGTLSIAPQVEMMMGHGMPPIQKALDRGIRPSLSVDVETNVGSDLFLQMQTILALQRAQIFERQLAGEENLPALLTARDVLEFATIEGARANGLAHRTGSLTPGKDADILLLRKDTINVAPISQASGAVVLMMDTSNVDTVIVAGTFMKQNGELIGSDVAAVLDKAVAARERSLSAADYPKGIV